MVHKQFIGIYCRYRDVLFRLEVFYQYDGGRLLLVVVVSLDGRDQYYLSNLLVCNRIVGVRSTVLKQVWKLSSKFSKSTSSLNDEKLKEKKNDPSHT